MFYPFVLFSPETSSGPRRHSEIISNITHTHTHTRTHKRVQRIWERKSKKKGSKQSLEPIKCRRLFTSRLYDTVPVYARRYARQSSLAVSGHSAAKKNIKHRFLYAAATRRSGQHIPVGFWRSFQRFLRGNGAATGCSGYTGPKPSKNHLLKHCNALCVRYNVFTERVVNVWNPLPNTVDFNSLAVFKRTIKRVQWRRNEVESGCTDPAQSAGNFFFLVMPFHFFWLQKYN